MLCFHVNNVCCVMSYTCLTSRLTWLSPLCGLRAARAPMALGEVWLLGLTTVWLSMSSSFAIPSLGHNLLIILVPHSHACCADLYSENLCRTVSFAPISHTTHLWSTVELTLHLHSLTTTEQCQIAHGNPPSILTLSLSHTLIGPTKYKGLRKNSSPFVSD